MNISRKILVDLGKLRNRYTGLGEVAFHFGTHLAGKATALRQQNIELYYLVPRQYAGYWGSDVKYVTLNFFRRHFPGLNLKYDLWHSIHQDSSYMPGNKNCKYLLTIHDLNFLYRRNKKKAEIKLQRIQKKINKAVAITAISNFTREEICRKLNTGSKTPVVIYNGCVDYSKTGAKKPGNIGDNEQFFLHISSITPKKNTKSLVEMMKRWPEKKLIIAGSWDNAYANEIIREIKKENITNIICLSKINHAEKAWLYMHCEALFFPSLLEGFGLPVIEAMYCGKPVFTSTCTSLPEIGSDKAFYWDSFEPGYMKKIAEEKLALINHDPGFATSLKQYAAQFSWANNVNRYIELYTDILGNETVNEAESRGR